MAYPRIEESEQQFVEILGVYVEVGRDRASTFEVVLMHANGEEEKLQTKKKAKVASFECHTFVECIGKVGQPSEESSTKTSTKNDRSEPEIKIRLRDKEKSQLASFFLRSIYDASESEIIAGHGDQSSRTFKDTGSMLRLTLGQTVSASEVARVRLQQAQTDLASKDSMMNKIESATTRLRLLISIGTSASEIHNLTKVVASITQTLFKQFETISKRHESLRDLILSLADDLSLAQEERKHFNTVSARNAIDELIRLVSEAALEISRFYSASRPVFLAREFISPSDVRFTEFRRRLRLQSEKIKRAFLTEINIYASETKEGVLEVKSAIRLAEEKTLLEKLLPPEDSQSGGKPICLEGTRRTVLTTIHEWVDSMQKPSRLFWLYAVAGCGKSSVAVSTCRELGSRLAGSFFCKRDHTERRNPLRMIWAIAFYLAKANISYKVALLQALREPDIFVSMDLDSQFMSLLEEPLLLLKTQTDLVPTIFLVDALDECEQSEKLAKLIGRLIQLAPWLHVILTSRPDTGIAREVSKLAGLHHPYDLFSTDAHEDIRTYLRHEIGSDGKLSDVGPFVEPYVDSFVEKSQGLFIWIRTVVEYILKTEVGKLEVIEAIQESDVQARAEGALDALYRSVLQNAAGSTETGRKLVSLIMGFVLASSEVAPMTADVMYGFLPPSMLVVHGEFMTVFRKLLTLLVMDSTSVRVFHTSLLDFIASKERCGDPFFMALPDVHTILAAGCFEIMKEGTRSRKRHPTAMTGLTFNICVLRSSYLANDEVEGLELTISKNISAELVYSCAHWAAHTLQADRSGGSYGFEISELTGYFFASTQSIFWLEVLSLVHGLPNACSALESILREKIWLKEGTLALARELRAHIERFYPIMVLSTPHIYVTAICWILEESPLWYAWKEICTMNRIFDCKLGGRTHILRSIDFGTRAESFAITSDERYIAIGSDGAIALWDLHSGVLLAKRPVFEGTDHKFEVSECNIKFATVDFCTFTSSDSELIVGSLYSNVLLRKDVRTLLHDIGAPLCEHNANITSLASNPTGSIFASASHDDTIVIWSGNSCEALHKFASDRGRIRCLTFSSDGKLLAALAHKSEEWHIWEVQTAKFLVKSSPPIDEDDFITAMTFSIDGSRIATSMCSGDISVWGWRPGTSGELQAYVESKTFLKNCNVNMLLWSPSGNSIVALKEEASSLLVWNYTGESDTLGSARIYKLECNTLIGGRFSSLGSRIFITCHKSVIVFDYQALTDPNLLQHSVDTTETDLSANNGGRPAYLERSSYLDVDVFSSDNRQMLCLYGNSVQIWDLSDGSLEQEVSKDNELPVCISSDGALAAFVHSGDIKIYEVQYGSENCIYRLPNAIETKFDTIAGTFSPDKTKLVVSLTEPTYISGDFIKEQLTVCLINLLDGTKIMVEQDPLSLRDRDFLYPRTRIEFSRDGSIFAYGVSNKPTGTLKLFQGQTGTSYSALGAFTFIISISFSPDGHSIICLLHTGILRIFDLLTRSYLQTIAPFTMQNDDLGVPNHILHYSPSGQIIYSYFPNGSMQLWDVEQGRQLGLTLTTKASRKTGLLVSCDGRYLVSRTLGEARIWDAQVFYHKLDTSLCANGVLGPEKIPSKIDEDGWLRTGDGGFLLWVPKEYRVRLCDASMLRLPETEENHPIRIRWDKFNHGENWTGMYTCIRE